MISLKMQLGHAQKHLDQMRHRMLEQEQLIRELDDLRADCPHEWGDVAVGAEHEGRSCKQCGINDQYAPTHKRLAEWRAQQKLKGI